MAKPDSSAPLGSGGREVAVMSEVRESKCAEVFLRSSVICNRGFFDIAEKTNVESSPIYSYLRSPFPRLFVPVHAFISGFAPSRFIGIVAGDRGLSQIMASIIERISVVVIRQFISSNYPVHQQCLGFPANSDASGSVRKSIDALCNAPVKSIEPFVIGGIYDSIHAFCKRDKFDRLILRLNNFVSRCTWSTHKEPPFLCGVQPHSHNTIRLGEYVHA